MKNTMMRSLALVLALVLALSLAACGTDGKVAAGGSADPTEGGASQQQDASPAETVGALGTLLDDIAANTQVATAGSSLQQTLAAARLLDFFAAEPMTAQEAKSAGAAWLADKTAEEQETVRELMTALNSQLDVLSLEDAEDMLSAAGYTGDGYPWQQAAEDAAYGLMEGLGVRA